MTDALKEQLIKHVTDVHSIEEQALQQMQVAPRLARDPVLTVTTRPTPMRPPCLRRCG